MCRRKKNARRDWNEKNARNVRNARKDVKAETIIETIRIKIVQFVHVKCQEVTVQAAV